jgi:hypothetical protein
LLLKFLKIISDRVCGSAADLIITFNAKEMLSKAQGIVKPEEENILRIPVFLLYVTLCRNLRPAQSKKDLTT